MSNSYKKHPIGGNTTCDSEKKDKTFANRAYRRHCKQLLKINPDTEFPLVKGFRDPWMFDKDGKTYHGWKYPKVWRK